MMNKALCDVLIKTMHRVIVPIAKFTLEWESPE